MYRKLLALLDPPSEVPLSGDVQFTCLGIGGTALYLAAKGGPHPQVRWQWTSEAPIKGLRDFIAQWVTPGSDLCVSNEDILEVLEDDGLFEFDFEYDLPAIQAIRQRISRHSGVDSRRWWSLCLPVLAFQMEMRPQTRWERFEEILRRAARRGS
ncbi:MAG: hypothetical protein ACYCZN_14065 [Candidatus Dormibacteria bacterium]